MKLADQHILAVTVLAVAQAHSSLVNTQRASYHERPLQTQPSSVAVSKPSPLKTQNAWFFEQLASPTPLVEMLLEYDDSDIKFELTSLMNILRDGRHEGWVRTAYPDPKTAQPLIGAGFNLDVRETQHMQRNPLNPYAFIEPSTAQLWQAAGLDLEQLKHILDRFYLRLKVWNTKKFRRKIKTHELPSELTDEEATRLLRISALQAIHNAKAYCVHFDQLNASQQMALSQLVFQMGVNLEEFVEFLRVINEQSGTGNLTQGDGSIEREDVNWSTVQRTLLRSDWARRYPNRAVTVIAMFDPSYDNQPEEAERQVRARMRPLVHYRKRPFPRSRRTGKNRGHKGRRLVS